MYENSYNEMKQIRLSDAKSRRYTTLLSLISNVWKIIQLIQTLQLKVSNMQGTIWNLYNKMKQKRTAHVMENPADVHICV